MKTSESLFFKDRHSFRNWLQKNHHSCDGIWMVYYKKHTGKQCIDYREALEEALCFGWIDSIIKRLDDEKYVRKFTPRKDCKNWSDLNKTIVLEMIRTKKMTPAGLSKIDPSVALKHKSSIEKNLHVEAERIIVPDYLKEALSENKPASKNFNNLAPSHKRQYISWNSFAGHRYFF